VKALFAATAATLVLAAPAYAEPPPASAFGRIPAVAQAEISPNGQHVAILGGTADQRTLSIATIDQPGLPTLALGDVEAVGLAWVGDDHVLTRIAFWKSFGPRHAYRFERNVAVDLQGRAVARLLDKDGLSEALTEQPVLGTTSADAPRALMVGMTEGSGPNARMDTKIARKGVENPFVAALFSVDPATGKGALVERGTYDTSGWEVDAQGQPRVRFDHDQVTHRFTIMARAKGKPQYSKVFGGDYASYRTYAGYSDPEDAIYLTENGRLMRLRLADGETTPVGPPLDGVNPSTLWDTARRALIGIDTGLEKPRIEWTDPEIGAVHAALSKVFKDQVVEFSGWSDDRTRFVVRVTSPSAAPTWYLFDKTRKELSPLGEEYPELKGAPLGATRWISYKARDGLEIPAYLTLPPGAFGGAKLPLIVLPHGGPVARDGYDFDFLTQFLATRGYAVLRPQFRGSAGFGDAFEKAGYGEWGGLMQTDLLDGVAALAASGDIDPKRVCIVGASFGGYAALAGAAFHSDAYRCAASFAGISDLGLLGVEEGRLYGRDSSGMKEFHDMLGKASPEKLAQVSPAKHAADVNIPVLLIHGDKDTVVQLEQTTLMADALKGAGKPVETVILADENHYLTRASTRTQMLQALEAFLAKNLPARP
jgi:dienelactone hydrolase